MTLQAGPGVPAVEARLNWNVELLAGFDFESTLGLSRSNSVIPLGLPGSILGISSLYSVGTAEEIFITNDRKITPRKGFNSNPMQVFQNAPHGVTYGLRLNRIKLRVLPAAEAVFQVFPSNLILQQLPLVMHLTDEGDGTPETFVEHYIYSCWFQSSALHYSVVDKQNTKLIENVVVMPGRMVTFDASAQGDPTLTPASAVALTLARVGTLATQSNVLLSNFNF